LLVVAATAGLLLMTAARKALVEYRRTARAVAVWMREARPLAIPPLGLPALRIEHAFPLAAVAGVRRPRLLFATGVVQALTTDELRAVATHESGHLAARDVLKRLVLRACPDPLPWTGARARLEQSWERAAEAAADDFAARRVPRLHLASALVKIASLVPPGRGLSLELPAFAAGAPVAARVYDLLAGEPTPCPPEASRGLRAAIGVGAAAGLALLPFALPATHRFLEAVVTALS
jgi:Zn-dependent protease with chaperone function